MAFPLAEMANVATQISDGPTGIDLAAFRIAEAAKAAPARGRSSVFAATSVVRFFLAG